MAELTAGLKDVTLVENSVEILVVQWAEATAG